MIAVASVLLAVLIFFMPLGFYLFNFTFYNELYTRNGVYQDLNRQDVKQMTLKVFDFFKYRGDLEGQVRFADPTRSLVAFFDDNEISHMEDVRELLRNIFILFFSSLIMFAIMFFLVLFLDRGHSLRKVKLVFIWSSSIVLAVFILLLILSMNFSSLFDRFHVIFFPQGNYMFQQGSLLITMFPFGFFYQFFIMLALSSSVLAGLLLLLGVVFSIITNRKGNQSVG